MGQVNHVIPRRIASERRCHALNGLCLLCQFCHSYVTSTVEVELFQGNVQIYERFLAVIGEPIPSPSTIQRAYQRIRELQV
jgi:hypothetical protein